MVRAGIFFKKTTVLWHRAMPSGAKDGLREERPPLQTPQNYAPNARVIHKDLYSI